MKQPNTEQIIYFDTLRQCWCVTARENYEARIRNARTVLACDGFKTPQELRDYLVNRGYGTKDQYIIIPQEEKQ